MILPGLAALLSWIDMIEDLIPNVSNILNDLYSCGEGLIYRNLLEENESRNQILESMNQTLRAKGAMLEEWTILDSTINYSPSST